LGWGGVLVPLLIPLNPIALALGIKANKDLKAIDRHEGSGSIGCAILLATMGTLSMIGRFIIMTMGGK
jgi:hypothetical protein